MYLTKMSVKRVVRSHQNLKKYEIKKSLKQKLGRGRRGSGPHSERIQRKIDLLGFEIWHYGKRISKIFQQFSNHFSIFIIHAKVVPHSGLLKRTKMHSFFEIFQAPPKIFKPTTI